MRSVREHQQGQILLCSVHDGAVLFRTISVFMSSVGNNGLHILHCVTPDDGGTMKPRLSAG